jgi:hypothetical protein
VTYNSSNREHGLEAVAVDVIDEVEYDPFGPATAQ